RGIETHRRSVHAAGDGMHSFEARAPHRHQPRLAQRPDHEPVRRHAAGHGRKRAGVRPHLPQTRLPQLQVLDEIEQPEGDDRVLPIARRPARTGRPGLELPGPSRCHRTGRVVVTRATWEKVAPKIRPKDDVKPEAIYEDLNVMEVDPTNDFDVNCDTQLITVKDGLSLPAITAFRLLAARLKRLGRNNPILLKDCLNFGIEAASPLTPSLSPSDGERVTKPGEGNVW